LAGKRRKGGGRKRFRKGEKKKTREVVKKLGGRGREVTRLPRTGEKLEKGKGEKKKERRPQIEEKNKKTLCGSLKRKRQINANTSRKKRQGPKGPKGKTKGRL